MSCKRIFKFALLAAVAASNAPVSAIDWTEGLLRAVPAPKNVTIDGDLSDWDRSATEPVYIAPQTIRKLNAEWTMMYDDSALYVGVVTSLPNRPLSNEAEPQDAFWNGDLAQIRLATDPAFAYPLDINRDASSDRVMHISFWKNSANGHDYVQITRGIRFDHGSSVNPSGSQIVIKTDNQTYYTIEAKIPWSALGANSGNPFKPGQKMTGVIENLWGVDAARTVAVYSSNPGAFAFNQPGKWGQILFEPRGFDKPRRPSMAAIINDVTIKNVARPKPGKAFTVNVPDDNLKVSVNIFGEKGEVIREIIGGESHPKGALTLNWDGRDQWGRGVAPGTYRWGAYFSSGLEAEYAGSAYSAGNPTYPTLDGKGGWGAEHSNPIDVTTDPSGWYFLWPVAEGGKPIVKTDFTGQVIWRKNPFVGGGFGPFYAITTDEKYVFLVIGDKNVRLVRLDAATGQLLTWNDQNMTELPVYQVAEEPRVAIADSPFTEEQRPEPRKQPINDGRSVHPDATGLSLYEDELYLSCFTENVIRVLNKNTGTVVRQLEATGPRGSAIDSRTGDLYVTSYEPGKPGRVLRFKKGSSEAESVISSDLVAPYDVSVDANGRLFVSDLGTSQQIKVFTADGHLSAAWGRQGGRPWQGKYANDAFLHPAGIALDDQGGLLVIESAIPKVISRLDAASGKVTRQFFGPGTYWNATWPMPTDPTLVFSSTTNGLVLGKPAKPGESWAPLAYFAPNHQFPTITTDLEAFMAHPETIKATNGRIYVMRDADPRAIFLFDEATATLRPIATFTVERNPYVDAWIDTNADGLAQDNEKHRITHLADGKPVPERFSGQTAATHIDANGDLYFTTHKNSVMKLPATGFEPDGSIRWDLKGARIAIPRVVPTPGHENLGGGWRTGILGFRNDSAGNAYMCVNLRLPGERDQYDYPSKELAVQMHEGMGHTSTFNAVKFAKYDPQGNVIWMAGRKATAGAQPGEMYHFWNIAGLVNDKYIAGASEWGRIYFYTADGFYVDGIMNDPADSPPPGPYTFGGETSGGRVAYFADSGDLWAYSSGMAYRVKGFKNGQVVNESRTNGQIQLDRVYDLDTADPAQDRPAIQIVKVDATPHDVNGAWADAPAISVNSNGKPIAEAKLAHDDKFLYARIRVNDPTPLQNSADDLAMAFKGGDSVAIVLGPDGQREAPAAGDVRFIATRIKDQPKLIVMRPIAPAGATKLRPFEYITPAAGTVRFADVGEVSGGVVKFDESADGYTVSLTIPLEAIGLPIKSGTALKGDIEVRLSGVGARGLQTTSRNYLYAPATSETTMVDDVPTESRLFPQYFGPVIVR